MDYQRLRSYVASWFEPLADTIIFIPTAVEERGLPQELEDTDRAMVLALYDADGEELDYPGYTRQLVISELISSPWWGQVMRNTNEIQFAETPNFGKPIEIYKGIVWQGSRAVLQAPVTPPFVSELGLAFHIKPGKLVVPLREATP
jgi:hypothetical protein